MRRFFHSFSGRRFGGDEDGSITAESVLWIPVYMVFFALIVDVSLVLHGQAKATRVAQDANRLASTEFYIDEADLEAMVKRGIDHFAPNAKVTSDIGNAAVTTLIELPVSDLEAVGLFGRFSGITVTVSTIHLLEI